MLYSIYSRKQTMSIFANIHNKGLLQKLKNFCNNFLHSLEMFQGRLVVVPLYSHYTNNPAHRVVAGNLLNEFFENTYINTAKNCIHFLCKNDFEFLTLADC